MNLSIYLGIYIYNLLKYINAIYMWLCYKNFLLLISIIVNDIGNERWSLAGLTDIKLFHLSVECISGYP